MRQGNAPAAAQVRSGDVLERVKKVELLLEKQIKLMERHFDPVLNSTVPTSNYTAMAHQTLPSTAGPVLSKPNGSIVTNVEGYQRYIPGLTLSDGSAVNEMIQSGSSPALSSNFPFSTDSKSTRQSLLEVLPPVRQCEELKIVFMNVFSPVCPLLLRISLPLSQGADTVHASSFMSCMTLPSRLNTLRSASVPEKYLFHFSLCCSSCFQSPSLAWTTVIRC